MSRHRRHRKLRSVFQWHRYAGLAAFLFLMMLVITGILLNHTERMSLDQNYVGSDLVLDWYGINPPRIDAAFRTARHTIVQIEDRLYFNYRPLTERIAALRGAVNVAGLVAIAVDDALLLLTPTGELVERLGDAQGSPSGVRAIGRTNDGRVVVNAAHGLYATDKDFLGWQRYRGKECVRWSTPQSVSSEVAQELKRHYRAHVLPLERVILDLHSGRILGSWGVFVIDAAALLLSFLGMSGCWLWYERYRKRKAHWKVSAVHREDRR